LLVTVCCGRQSDAESLGVEGWSMFVRIDGQGPFELETLIEANETCLTSEEVGTMVHELYTAGEHRIAIGGGVVTITVASDDQWESELRPALAA
jgi:hypothetical protein